MMHTRRKRKEQLDWNIFQTLYYPQPKHFTSEIFSVCFVNVLGTPSTERPSSPVGEFWLCSPIQDYIPLYLNQSLKNTWKSGVSFKGIKIFYCDTEDRQIAISHFTVFSAKNVTLLYKESMFVMGSFSISLHSENFFSEVSFFSQDPWLHAN